MQQAAIYSLIWFYGYFEAEPIQYTCHSLARLSAYVEHPRSEGLVHNHGTRRPTPASSNVAAGPYPVLTGLTYEFISGSIVKIKNDKPSRRGPAQVGNSVSDPRGPYATPSRDPRPLQITTPFWSYRRIYHATTQKNGMHVITKWNKRWYAWERTSQCSHAAEPRVHRGPPASPVSGPQSSC